MAEQQRVGVDFSHRETVGPYDFTLPTLLEWRSLKALSEGTADEAQQKRALLWILHSACAVQSETFNSGGNGVAEYNQGRRGAGLRILRALGMKPDDFKQSEKQRHE